MFDCGMMKSGEKRLLTKADILLIIGMAAAALVIWLFMLLGREPGKYVRISCDGEQIEEILLPETGEKYYLIMGEEGKNGSGSGSMDENGDSNGAGNGEDSERTIVRELSAETWEKWSQESGQEGAAVTENAALRYEAYNILVCREGEVSVIAADCPDQICVHHTPVSKAGENIICLPHKVVVEIVADKAIGGNGDNSGENELDGVIY
ncbi:MAG: NusG domain II-containing protein [Roseburia sp.]|nr:NusG domain II-containing protein [Roseburia sp.]MCM1241683.1 NusG domain II-containing protein [Roseburia sp.]